MWKADLLKLFLINAAINFHGRIHWSFLLDRWQLCLTFILRWLRVYWILVLLVDWTWGLFFFGVAWICVLSSLRLWLRLRLVFLTDLNNHLLLIFWATSDKRAALVDVDDAHMLSDNFFVTAGLAQILILLRASCVFWWFSLCNYFSLFLGIFLCFELVLSCSILFLFLFLLLF